MSEIFRRKPTKEEQNWLDAARQLDDASNGTFWKRALMQNVEHCTPEFAEKLQYNYEKLKEVECIEDIDSLIAKIQTKTMRICSADFAYLVNTFYDSLAGADGLGELTEEYELDRENPDKNDKDLAVRIAFEVRKICHKGEVDTFDKFKSIYTQSAPCSKVYKALEQPNLQTYERFLRLAMVPGFRAKVSWDHADAVGILTTCDYIRDSSKLMQAAFESYMYQDDLKDTRWIKTWSDK